MKILIQQLLKIVLQDFERLIVPPLPIGLRLVSKEKIIRDAKANFIYKLLIDKGVFTDFENEYPVFMVVYNYDKNLLNIPITGKCWIGYCEEIAVTHLENLSIADKMCYIKYALAHEVTHIMEDIIKQDSPDLYNKAWEQNDGKGIQQSQYTSETLAENVAFMIVDKDEVTPIVNKIWGGIFKKTSELF